MKSYINSLSRKDRFSIQTTKSNNKFRFGNGVLYPGDYHIIIPIYIGKSKYRLGVDIVKCNIPLLLSRKTLKRAKAKIDICEATICFMGTIISLSISSSGHLCLPIRRPLDLSNDETQKVLARVLLSSPLDGVSLDLKNKAKKTTYAVLPSEC